MVDQHGNLLSQDLEEAMSGSGLTVRQLDYQKRVEKGYERRVSEMLQPLLGANNYRVQVTANLSFDTVEETRESLEPTPIVREERLLKDASQGGQLDAVPGALSNRPPVTDANNPANAAPQQPVTAARAVNERDEQQRRYDVGRTITHTKYQLGRLNNISVSVVLNQAIAPEKGWDEAHLSNVRRMAQDAVGFNQDRGDQFSLNAFPFSENGYTSDSAWWQAPVVLIYARYLVGTILGLSLIFFGIRKLMNYLMLRHQQEAQNQPTRTANSTSGIGRQPFSTGPLPQGDHFEPRETNLKFANVRMNELPDINSPLQEKLAHLQLLADNDPKRVAEVLEQWMNSR
ncbi:Flagellar M-ring protein [compost metagenome]